MDWYKLKAEAVTEKLNTDAVDGLTSTEAVRRLEQYGPNQLEERGATSTWVLIIRQFREIMVIILIIAAVVSALLGEFADVVVILAIVILNAVIGFSQEQRAEKAMAALKKLAVPTVRVRRDADVQEISSIQLVPGDVVILEAGNVVPADGRVLETVNLKIEEAALTGESDAVDKILAVPEGEDLQIGDRLDMVYMGTVVTYGRGSYVVTETGMDTELGHIADLIQSVEDEQTPLQRRLGQLGRTLAWVAFGIIAVVVVLGLLRGDDIEILFLTAIGMAVAAVPEGLPAVVTITLALGGQRLLARHALIRKLPAVETLGSVTVICSDKTGTLTENRMTVTMLDVAGNVEDIQTLVDRKGVLLDGKIVDETEPQMTAIGVLVRAGALVNDAVLKVDDRGVQRALGDPTEGALVVAAARLGYQKDELDKRWPRVGEIPFTSERKRMTTIHRMDDAVRETDLPWSDAPYVLLSKGAVDSLMTVTSHVLVDNEIIPLDEEWRERIEEANARMAREGQRVLGVAFRLWDSPELPDAEEQLEAEQTFVGMFAMMDPPRPEVEEAVRTAKKAGIRPVMITGDHPLTAHRIAQDLGIAANGDRALTGAELASMSIDELEACVDEVSVYARVAPEHKLNIVQALQNKGQIAAMTGDGVNDAPALKRADIGVAMGITGTDVSKEAADMVLLDDNFATIVEAVDEGRVIYDNIRKFIKYTLSSNTGELFVMLVGPLLGMPLPLRPLQILWINLVTDGLPGLALAVEKGERGTMDRPPFKPDESVFSRGIGTQIIWVGLLMGLISLWVGYQFFQMENDAWQTMVFTTLVLAQMGNALAIRSNTDSLFTIGIFSNRLMVTAVLVTFALQLVLIYLPLAQRVFGTVALTLQELLICLLASSVVFIVLEIYKWIRRMRIG
jgi:Ca2+-transporting ATPase